MSADLVVTLAAIVMQGIGLAVLNVVLWRSVGADIRAVRAAIDADRVAHEALHAAERQARTDEKRELLAAIAGSREGAA